MELLFKLIISLPLVICGMRVMILVVNKLKGIMISKTCAVKKMTVLKLIIGLVGLIPLTYYFFWFYCYTYYLAFFLSIDINAWIYMSGFEAQRKTFETGIADAPYILYIPAITMIMGFCIHCFCIQKSCRKYFHITAILGIIFLYNALLAYQIGNRLHEMDIIMGTMELNSTYGLTEMLSDVNTWVIIICGFTIFAIWSVVLNMTICACNKLCAVKVNNVNGIETNDNIWQQ